LIKEAIILAGGLGTRLRETVPDLPKCMAPVAGEPFLTYVIRSLLANGVEKFIFSLGYKHEIIESFLEERFTTLNYTCVIEDEPLGTGGAIQLACEQATEENVLIVNGDTLFKINAASILEVHKKQNAECTIALKPMQDFDRYGVVELSKENLVTKFYEKQFYKEGLINGGVYILNVPAFLSKDLGNKFSFEKDYLEAFYSESRIAGTIQDEYFIDIGIPQDFEKAQIELKQPVLDLKKVDSRWTLFLDRDGVINHEKKDEYVLNKSEFKFYDGVLEAMKLFPSKFNNIVIVTNQRGIGKGLMTEDDLTSIHEHMLAEIQSNGGKVDKIYYCTSTEKTAFNRKPNPGMALLAKNDFPEIDFSKSIMVGNKLTDMLFGRNAGIFTVFTATTNPDIAFPHPDIDFRFNNLPEFAKAL
jgi:D-glycero-alpha-D-manno-heptose 1-phosphate guanylyltransferase